MTSYKALKSKVEAAGGAESGLYIVPEWNMNDLTKKITRQGKRAVELGCVPPRIEIVETVEVEFAKATGRFDLTGKEIFRTVVFECNVLRIVGEAPMLNGWTFAAKITFGDDQGAGNLIYRVPGFKGEIPPSFRKADPRLCEHCETVRQRKDVFILQHEGGDWKQVGRTCLADFLGHVSPEKFAQYAEALYKMFKNSDADPSDPGFWGGSYEELPVEMLSFLTVTAAVIKSFGWLSVSKAREINANAGGEAQHKLATVSNVYEYYSNPFSKDGERWHRELVAKIDSNTGAAEAELAERAMNWARALPEDITNDYLWNLRVLAIQNSVPRKNFGLAASLLAAYQRDVNKQADAIAPDAKKNETFGTEKKRENFTLKVVFTKWIDNGFGGATLVKFEDLEGRAAVWFASNCPDEIVTGVTVEVKATVKGFDVYNDQHQTKLNRVMVIKVVEAFPETAERLTDVAVETAVKDARKEKALHLNRMLDESGELIGEFMEETSQRRALGLQPFAEEQAKAAKVSDERAQNLCEANSILWARIKAATHDLGLDGVKFDANTCKALLW